MSAILLESDLLHYEVLGRGKPILFLHGWVGSWRYWIPAMQAASIHYRAYALDFWGFGDTAKNLNYNIADQWSMIEQFMGQMGLRKVAVVGHGLGAVAAIQFALRSPNMVDRIMAVSYPLSVQRVSSRFLAASPVELADWLLGRGSETEPVLADAPKNDPKAIESSIMDLRNIDLQASWHDIRTNCLLVYGQQDPAISPPTGDQLDELPEQIHLVTFEESAHFPMLTESSKFNRLLIDFLGLASGDSPRQLQLKDEWKRRVR